MQVEVIYNVSNTTQTLIPTNADVYNSTHYVLASLYFFLTLSTIVLVMYKAAVGTLKETWKGFFFVFVILGAALRGLWALFSPMMLQGLIRMSNRTDLFLNLFPSILFFSNYLILLFIWVEIYHFPMRAGMSIHHLRPHLWITLGLMFLGFIVLFVVDVFLYDSPYVKISGPMNPVERGIVLYVATLYLLTSAAFTIYGLLILIPLWRNDAMDSQRRRQLLLRMLALTGLIVTIFLVRSGFVFIGYFSNWSFVSYFDLVYYFMCEILPLALMLFILLYRSGSPNANVNMNKNSGTSDERSHLYGQVY